MLNELTTPSESHGGPIRICAVDDAGRGGGGGISPPIGSQPRHSRFIETQYFLRMAGILATQIDR